MKNESPSTWTEGEKGEAVFLEEALPPMFTEGLGKPGLRIASRDEEVSKVVRRPTMTLESDGICKVGRGSPNPGGGAKPGGGRMAKPSQY